MISTKPIAIPIAATMPTRISWPSTERRPLKQLAGTVIAPPVLHVGDELDDHAGEQRAAPRS